jgi:peptide/nickel transport system permease protein
MTDLTLDVPRSTTASAGTLGLLVLRRLVGAVFVLWVAVSLTFVAVHLTPGDTVSLMLGENRDDPVLRAQTIERWGLDQPLWVQYLTYLSRIPKGDLGISYTLRRPVSDLIVMGMGPTFQLTAAAALGAILIAVIGAVLTTAPIPGLRRAASVVELVLVSAPPFWLAIVLLWAISFKLGWFSIVQQGSWQSLVLPTASLALPIGAYLTQVLVEGLDKAMAEPFVVTARARGISQLAARGRHALRHAALPVVHLVGLIVGSLLGGAVIVEQVFGRPGLGQLAVDAVTVKDVPLILGITLVTTAAFVVASTLVDLVGLLIDPRIRSAS